MYTTHNTAGYSLVEVLVAISILMLAIVGPLTIASKSIQSARYASEQTIALYLAQEGIEAFVAVRNDAILEEFKPSGNFADSWNWTSSGLAPCRSTNGCAVDFDNATDPLAAVTNCGSGGVNCVLYYDENRTIPYSHDSSGSASESPYTRVIKLTNDASGGNGLQLEATVSWDSALFGGSTKSVTLTSSLFQLYD